MNLNRKEKSVAQTSRSHPYSPKKRRISPEKSPFKETRKEKKKWSTEALIKSMKPSSEEHKFREEKLNEKNFLNKIQNYFRCTKCMLNFNPLIEKHEKIPVHSILGVLMCQKCCDYYEDGEFSMDSEGEEKYCRWCGEGGTIFSCAQCICGFCAQCIKRHFPNSFFKKVEREDNWLCFFCDPKPLWLLRFICAQAVKASESDFTSSSSNNNCKDVDTELSSSSGSLKIKPSFKSQERKKKSRAYTCISSSDESENDEENLQKKLKLTKTSGDDSTNKKGTKSCETAKSNILEELEKIIKLSEYQLSFGVTWSQNTLKKLKSSDFLKTNTNLANECQKIKWFLSLLSTYLVQFCNFVNSVEKSLIKDDGSKNSGLPEKNDAPYSIILQFLGFINTQVKTFMEKGIDLSDVLEAELYDDENFIGIKKKVVSKGVSQKEKNINIRKKTNLKTYEIIDVENKDSAEEQRTDSESKDKGECSLDLIGDQNSEINSTECDKELNNSDLTLREINDFKTSDPEEDIQEILAILENA